MILERIPINENSYRNLIKKKYEFDEKQEPIQYQLALLYETPLSKNYFELWMAFISWPIRSSSRRLLSWIPSPMPMRGGYLSAF
jgi:hypothetical protein